MTMINKSTEKYIWQKFEIGKKSQDFVHVFFSTNNDEMLKRLLIPRTETTLSISVGSFASPERQSLYLAPLYFEIYLKDFTKVCNSAGKVLSYLFENAGILNNCVEIICKSEFSLVLVIPPIVFGGWPNKLMTKINYYLAKRLVDEGIDGIRLKAYDKDYFLPVPNSKQFLGDKYVISLTAHELNLPSTEIQRLAQEQRSVIYLAEPRRIAKTADWFAQAYLQIRENCQSQEKKFKRMLKTMGGWEEPPCIKKLKADMPKDSNNLEALMIIAKFLAWIKANSLEITLRLKCLMEFHTFEDLDELNAIVTYAIENAGFEGCENELLRERCPAKGDCTFSMFDI